MRLLGQACWACLAAFAGAGCASTVTCGEATVDIHATVVDVDTGRPIRGALVTARPGADTAGEGAGTRAVTASDGSLRMRAVARYGDYHGALGGPEDPPPYYGVETVVVSAEGYARQVVDCRHGEWKADGWQATLDLGAIRLRRE